MQVADVDIGRRLPRKGWSMRRCPGGSRRGASSSSPAARSSISRASPTARSPRARTAPRSRRPAVARDFALMRELGANAVRTFTSPPRWLLDARRRARARACSSAMPWAQHVCFLDAARPMAEIRRDGRRRGVARCRRPPGGLRPSSSATRSRPTSSAGTGPARRALPRASSRDEAKDGDPGRLVSYANFPPTEYLDSRLPRFRLLQRLPAPRGRVPPLPVATAEPGRRPPLVLTEFGVDSIREGEEEQARMLDWQVRAPRSRWARPAPSSSRAPTNGTRAATRSRTGRSVSSTATGSRSPPSTRCSSGTRAALPPAPSHRRRVSVVVCAYNAERTMEACLASLAACATRTTR